MSNRHHIHLVCDSNDEGLRSWQDALTMFFEGKARLSRDLFTMNTETNTYSWRCINQCTGVFVLLGHSYGVVNASGVSQLHISYLNAKTKNKPIIAFVKDDNQEKSKQLSDLIHIIKDQVKSIHYIKDNSNLAAIFGGAFEDLVLGIEDFRPNATEEVEEDLDLDDLIPKHPKATDSIASTTLVAREEDELPLRKPIKTPNLYDEILLNCTAHAFFGGTLEEMEFVARLKWHDILIALPDSIAFSLDTLSRALGELITPQAMPMIQQKRPNIHAISRCQVSKPDILWVQEELLAAGWIAKPENSTSLRELWRLTNAAKAILRV